MDFQIFKTGGKPNVSSFNNVNFIVGCYHTFCIVMFFSIKNGPHNCSYASSLGVRPCLTADTKRLPNGQTSMDFQNFKTGCKPKLCSFKKCKHFVSCNHRFCTIIIFSMIFVMRNCPSAFFLGLRPCLTTGTKTASKGSKL